MNKIKGKIKTFTGDKEKVQKVFFTPTEILEFINQSGIKPFFKNFFPSDPNNKFIKTLNTIDEIANVIVSSYHIEFIMLIGSFAAGNENYNDIDFFIITKNKITQAREKIRTLINSSKIPNNTNEIFDVIVLSSDEFFSSLWSKDFKVITSFLTGIFITGNDYWKELRERLKRINLGAEIPDNFIRVLYLESIGMVTTFEKNIKAIYFYSFYEGIIKLLHSFLLSKGKTSFNKDLILEELEELGKTDPFTKDIASLFEKFIKNKNVNINNPMQKNDFNTIYNGYLIGKEIVKKLSFLGETNENP